MAASREIPKGHGKLLEAWEPPDEAGDPIGCVATTFTFSPEFFEGECLGRFLKLETNVDEDGPLYLIEREEKLAQVRCAAVIVDQHHCKGSRSLRWDLHAARPETGILHAKVSLLCWSRRIRLIVASANLTDDGYRRNREVYGVLDYFEGAESPIQVLREVIAFLRDGRTRAGQTDDLGPGQRLVSFLDHVEQVSIAWGQTAETYAREPMRIVSLLTGPGRSDLFTQIADLWPGSSPPEKAYVLSPFFDPPEAKINRPAEAIWSVLRKRGDACVNYCVETEETKERGKLLARAPKSLLTTRPTRESCSVSFSALVSDTERPLHAKEIRFQNERYVGLVVGSSNFTSAGTGVGKVANFEANLVYILDADRAPKGSLSDFESRFPDSEDIEDPEQRLQFEPASDLGMDSETPGPLLPTGFISAIYRLVSVEKGKVEFIFGHSIPESWSVVTEDERVILREADWKANGTPESCLCDWTGRPPSGFWVSWTGADGKAWWPVNVASAADLPPPDELRDLSLEVLIDLLTSARPLHDTMREYLRRKNRPARDASSTTSPTLDPHKRVDTSGFLLQRTRRFSWALTGLRARLERPVTTDECLQWRLHGPVGVMAVAAALHREAKTEAERTFLVAELALELVRVKPRSGPGSLSEAKVRTALREVAQNLRSQIQASPDRQDGHLRTYIEKVFERLGAD